MSAPAASSSSPESTSVLIVDDQPRSLRMMRRMLAQGSVQSETSTSAHEALDLLQSQPQFDVVLSDLLMPEKSGIELFRSIREGIPGRPWLQLILVTGHASVESAVEAGRLRVANYIQKPVLSGDLVDVVRQAQHAAQRIRTESFPGIPAARSGGNQRLKRAAQVLVSELLEMLEEPARGRSGDRKILMSDAMPVPRGALLGSTELVQLDDAARALHVISALDRERREALGDAVDPEAVWDMLAELLRAQLCGRRVSVTSLCLASKVPVTTALRRINDLVAAGFVVRLQDPSDKRRFHVELTTAGLEKMRRLTEAVGKWTRGIAVDAPERASQAGDYGLEGPWDAYPGDDTAPTPERTSTTVARHMVKA